MTSFLQVIAVPHVTFASPGFKQSDQILGSRKPIMTRCDGAYCKDTPECHDSSQLTGTCILCSGEGLLSAILRYR